MGAKNKKIHNRPERWCTDFALQLSCEVKRSVLLRQELEVDALVRVIATTELWAELTPDLLQRDVIVEHFSGSVSTVAYANSVAKIAHLLQNFERVALKERGELRAPSIVMLAHQRPDRLLREKGLFEKTENPGIWIRRPLNLGGMFLVATSHLPPDPRYDWLRVTTRLPETKDEFRTAMRLMHEQKLSKLKEEVLERVVMEFFIDGKSPMELKAELAEERALRAQVEAERVKEREERLKEHEERLKEREERLKERDRRIELERELELMKAQIAELKK